MGTVCLRALTRRSGMTDIIMVKTLRARNVMRSKRPARRSREHAPSRSAEEPVAPRELMAASTSHHPPPAIRDARPTVALVGARRRGRFRLALCARASAQASAGTLGYLRGRTRHDDPITDVARGQSYDAWFLGECDDACINEAELHSAIEVG
jgi:hypothetical protein